MDLQVDEILVSEALLKEARRGSNFEARRELAKQVDGLSLYYYNLNADSIPDPVVVSLRELEEIGIIREVQVHASALLL